MTVLRCGFAFGEFLFLDNHIRCVDFIALLICITASLNPTDHSDLYAFSKILLGKFRTFSEDNTADEVGCRIALSLETSVYGKSVSYNDGISVSSDIWVSSQSPK